MTSIPFAPLRAPRRIAPALALVLASALCALGSAGASTYLVLPDGSGDTPSIAAALRLAVSGDVIELGDGVFRGPGNSDLDFEGKTLTLRSRSGNAEACVLDAEAGPAAPARLLRLGTGEGLGTLIEGIGFRGGYLTDGDGGALLLVGSAARLRACRFSGNTAREGGAVFVEGGTPSFEVCEFTTNTGATAGGGLAVSGGATAALSRCRFAANAAAYGGGLMVDAATLSIAECVFVGNSASARGGGLYAGDHAALAITHTTLAWNQSPAAGSIALATLSSLDLQHSIVAHSPAGEAVELRFASTAAVSCTDIFGNAGGDWTGALAPLQAVDGNLSLDPEFCGDASDGDVYLSAASPCVSPPDCGRMGALGVACGGRGVARINFSSIKRLYGGE